MSFAYLLLCANVLLCGVNVLSASCTRNEDCPQTEACIDNACDAHYLCVNLCAPHAVCIITNHSSDCSCNEGYQGNGHVGCVPASLLVNPTSVCQYDDDCSPELWCDRLNRVCITPCSRDKCGENAECVPVNHAIQCKCYAGYIGDPLLECFQDGSDEHHTMVIAGVAGVVAVAVLLVVCFICYRFIRKPREQRDEIYNYVYDHRCQSGQIRREGPLPPEQRPEQTSHYARIIGILRRKKPRVEDLVYAEILYDGASSLQGPPPPQLPPRNVTSPVDHDSTSFTALV